MEGEALVMAPRRAGRPSGTEATAACALEPLAHVLSRLLPRPVRPDEVCDRAVGLGLMRWPAAKPAALTAEAASRLLLAGYCLPGLVTSGTLASLPRHLREKRHVFILLRVPEGPPGLTEAVQVHGRLPGGDGAS